MNKNKNYLIAAILLLIAAILLIAGILLGIFVMANANSAMLEQASPTTRYHVAWAMMTLLTNPNVNCETEMIGGGTNVTIINHLWWTNTP